MIISYFCVWAHHTAHVYNNHHQYAIIVAHSLLSLRITHAFRSVPFIPVLWLSQCL